jgi:hypothetical protein
MATIITATAKFVFLLYCLPLGAQPVQRGFTTTNFVGFQANQFQTNGVPNSKVVLTNLATGDINGNTTVKSDGSIWGFGTSNYFNGLMMLEDGRVALPNRQNPFWGGQSNLFISSESYGVGQVSRFSTMTNNGADSGGAGWFVVTCPTITDNVLGMFVDKEKAIGFPGSIPYRLPPQRWLTNILFLGDGIYIGEPPGWGYVGTNTSTTPKLNLRFIDSVYVVGGGSCPYLTNLNAANVLDSFGTLLALNSCEGSAIQGAFAPTLTTSTNDVLTGALMSSWVGQSHENTFVGINIDNSTSGNSNTVLGAHCDLPINATDQQLNIANLIWGSKAFLSGNTPASGTVTINSNLVVRGNDVATNGYASFAPGIQSSISSSGFTNDAAHGFGTNSMAVHVNGSGQTIKFFFRGGTGGGSSCQTQLWSDTAQNDETWMVPVNCGFSLTGGSFVDGEAYPFP